MPVTVADLMAPAGPLEADFFPDTPAALPARLQAYIDRAAAVAADYAAAGIDADEATRLYALYLAFDALYLIKSNAPASSSMADLGSTSFNAAQIQAFRDRAREYRAAFEAMVPEELAANEPPAAQSLQARIVW